MLDNFRESIAKRMQTPLAKPTFVRPFFSLLRRYRPILKIGRIVVVSRYDDVREVLGEDQSFSVTQIYDAKMRMTTGTFVLGMRDTPQYRLELEAMHRAVRPDDREMISRFVTRCADQIVRQALPDGSIDAVGALSRVVPTRLVNFYFGVPGPDEATVMRWMRTIFRQIFLNLTNNKKMAADAVTSSQEMIEYLNRLISRTRAQFAQGKEPADSFLIRLIRDTSLDQQTIVRLIGGTIVGVVDTSSQAMAQALNQLLDRPDALKAAHEAALKREHEVVADHVFEALRFNPQNPLLIRYCESPYRIARGTKRETLAKEGSIVVAGTMSAMFDRNVVHSPNEFRPGRPKDTQIFFGHALHTCFGEHIARVMVPLVMESLLRTKGLRRASGSKGRLRYDGSFPARLIVEFETGHAHLIEQ